MSESLWTDIDNYLVTAITTDMGAASAYATLKLDQVVLSDSFQPDRYNPPTAIIFSNTARPIEQGPHADGEVHIYTEYRYFIAVIDNEQTTYAQGKANAQILLQRVREVIRGRFALGGTTSTIGETVYETVIQEMRAEVLGGQLGGKFRGVGVVPIIIRTEI